MNYEKMWKDLKQVIERDLDSYKEGCMMSLDESANGVARCNDFLRYMDDIEGKHKPSDFYRLVEARFKGVTSCGFETGITYKLKMISSGGRIIIYKANSDSYGYCPYSSMDAFLRNWDVINK